MSLARQSCTASASRCSRGVPCIAQAHSTGASFCAIASISTGRASHVAEGLVLRFIRLTDLWVRAQWEKKAQIGSDLLRFGVETLENTRNKAVT